MASLLYQTIEGLSREKGIDPQIVVSAVEDAIVVATRKYYKSQENLRAELDKESRRDQSLRGEDRGGDPGAGRGSEPADHAGRCEEDRSQRRGRGRGRASTRRTDGSGPHRGATGQAGDLPEGARGRARHRLQRVHRAGGRDRHRHGEAHRRPGRDLRGRQDGSPHAAQGAVAAGVVRRGRAREGGDRAGGESLRKARRWWFRGPRRNWCSTCSRPKCRRSTTARW